MKGFVSLSEVLENIIVLSLFSLRLFRCCLFDCFVFIFNSISYYASSFSVKFKKELKVVRGRGLKETQMF